MKLFIPIKSYKHFKPPYPTFNAFLQGLKLVKDNKDKTFTKEILMEQNISPSASARVISTMRDFGIIDTKGVVNSDLLRDYSFDDQIAIERFLKDKFTEIYSELLKNKDESGRLERSTIKEYMISHGLNGSTAQRGVVFFEAVCKYINASINIIERRGPCEGDTSESIERQVTTKDVQDEHAQLNSSNEHAIDLGKGNSISISMHIDLFTLNNKKRDQLLKVIDAIKILESEKEEEE